MTAAISATTGARHAIKSMERRALKWRALSLLMRTVGRLSDGIDLGYRRGFGSGDMLDYVYEDRARGKLGIGRVIDRVYLNTVGWRGVRNRRRLLQSVLRHEIAMNRAAGRGTRIVDVASGPGRYLLDVLGEDGCRDDVSALCRDLSASSIHRGRQLAREAGVRRIRYERGDALDHGSIASMGHAPDLIVVSGLYELILYRSLITRSLTARYDLARPGGAIVVTTQVRHPQLEMIANILPDREGQPCVMECRPVALTEQWLREAGFDVVGSDIEAEGLCTVTLARKRRIGTPGVPYFRFPKSVTN